MPIVALTGGVAAGKSTVTEVLEQRGALVVDADLLARDAVAPGSDGLVAVVERFGQEILDHDGALDRQALGNVVFADARARRDLEEIIHPIVKRLSHERFAQALAEDPHRVLVYAVPLLAESRSRAEFDVVVLVDAPAEVRVQRLVEHRGFTPDTAASRVASQASDDTRRAIADVILETSGTTEDTVALAHQLYDALEACWPDRLDQLPTVFRASQP
jgi:dephospho-CoA kinase